MVVWVVRAFRRLLGKPDPPFMWGATGSQRWVFDTRGRIQEGPIVANGAVYFAAVTPSGPVLYALDASSGAQLLAKKGSAPTRRRSPTASSTSAAPRPG